MNETCYKHQYNDERTSYTGVLYMVVLFSGIVVYRTCVRDSIFRRLGCFFHSAALPPPTYRCRTRHSTRISVYFRSIGLNGCTRDDRHTVCTATGAWRRHVPFPSQIASADFRFGDNTIADMDYC